MKYFAKWTLSVAILVGTAVLLSFTSATASLPVQWVVIAAGSNGGIAYSQGSNKNAVKSRVLARCKADNGNLGGNRGGNRGTCGSAWGETNAFLIVIQCPISATEKGTWGGVSDTSLAEAREGALNRMKNRTHSRTHSRDYLTRTQDCVDRISYSNGKILVP